VRERLQLTANKRRERETSRDVRHISFSASWQRENDYSRKLTRAWCPLDFPPGGRDECAVPVGHPIAFSISGWSDLELIGLATFIVLAAHLFTSFVWPSLRDVCSTVWGDSIAGIRRVRDDVRSLRHE
jgi:hypothetical protein